MPLNLGELDRRPYRPLVQWVWDCDPTAQRMREQLERMAAAGFGGVCIQPMPDNFRPHDFPTRMSMSYLGEAFFKAIREAVVISSELNLTIWLYDEGGWPSGQACGQVLDAHPALEGQVLVQEAGRFIIERTGMVDLLKPEATRRYMELTHHRYAEAVGEYFGSTIEAMFSDELTVRGQVGTDRIPWTNDLPECFKAHVGYDLEPVLPLLFEGSAARRHPDTQVRRVRRDFTQVWNQLFIERCVEPQQRWCHEHGLLFTGHLAGEHDLSRHPATFGDYMAVMRRFDMPGIDTIWRQIWPGHRTDFPLLAGSARVLHQRRFAMSETGAVYGRDLTGGGLKWLGDHQIMRGINRFTLMNLPLSGEDQSSISAMAADGPMWNAYGEWTQHIATFAALASAGSPGVRCGVLYPAEDLAARGGDGPGAAAQAIVEILMRLPGGCIYLDEASLVNARTTAEGQVLCGDARIESVIVAGGSLIGAALAQRLPTLADAGVRLLSIGAVLPCTWGHGNETTPLRCFEPLGFDTIENKPEAVLKSSSQRTYCYCSNPDLRVSHRSGDDWNLLLISNESLVPASTRLNLPQASVCCNVDTTLGPARAIEPTGIINLAPAQVVAVGWGRLDNLQVLTTANELSPCEKVEALWTITSAEGGPRIEGEDLRHVSPLGPWEPRLGRHFSGEVVYEAVIQMDHSTSSLTLDLGHVEHVAELRINGAIVGCRAWPPYQFTLDAHLRQGENRIEVRVANTPANAFWSPQHIAERKASGRWNIYDQRVLERCPPQLGGGLFGPVRWLRQTNREG